MQPDIEIDPDETRLLVHLRITPRARDAIDTWRKARYLSRANAASLIIERWTAQTETEEKA